MTKKQKTVLLLVLACAAVLGAVGFFMPQTVKITADLSQLTEQPVQNLLENRGGDETTVYYNSPNSQWWLERWLSSGSLFAPVTTSNKEKNAAVVTVDETAKRIDIVCVGQGDVKLNLTGFQSTPLGNLSKVKVTVESVRDSGELGAVYNATLRESYAAGTEKDVFRIHLKRTRPEDIYHIVIAPTGTVEIEDDTNERVPQRYEAEEAKQAGNTSIVKAENGKPGYVTGIEGDTSLTFRVKAAETGSYKINIIYTSGEGNGSGSLPYASQLLLLDGEQMAKMNYAPTGSEALFSSNPITLELDKGTHDITLKYASGGAAAIDCIDVTMLNGMREEAPSQIYQGVTDVDNTNSSTAAYFLPAPDEGYYDLTFYTVAAAEETVVCSIDGTESSVLKLDFMGESTTRVYLRKGINHVRLPHRESSFITGLTAVAAVVADEENPLLSVTDAGVAGGATAQIADNPAKTECTGGIATRDDSVTYSVAAPSAGTYKLSFSYAAAVPNGNAVLNILVNGQEQRAICENTFSESVFRSQTLTVELAAGENTVAFYGDGDSQEAQAVRIADVRVFLKCLDKTTE